jgi:hypothetical protein
MNYPHKLVEVSLFIAFTLVVFLILFAPMPPETDLEQQEADLYCEMVATYNQTGGEYGWPDYKKTFDKYCEVSK